MEKSYVQLALEVCGWPRPTAADDRYALLNDEVSETYANPGRPDQYNDNLAGRLDDRTIQTGEPE